MFWGQRFPEGWLTWGLSISQSGLQKAIYFSPSRRLVAICSNTCRLSSISALVLKKMEEPEMTKGVGKSQTVCALIMWHTQPPSCTRGKNELMVNLRNTYLSRIVFSSHMLDLGPSGVSQGKGLWWHREVCALIAFHPVGAAWGHLPLPSSSKYPSIPSDFWSVPKQSIRGFL